MSEAIWEILVPKFWPEQIASGKEIHVDYHSKWDEIVKDLAGGLTILRSAVGYWNPKEREMSVREEMIPVRIVCDEETIQKIAKFTLEHYQQEEVLAYKISDEIIRMTSEDEKRK